MTIPAELRQIILRYVLAVDGCISIKQPIWTTKDVYVPAVTQVCRSLRGEAIEAFYNVNVFMCHVDCRNGGHDTTTSVLSGARMAEEQVAGSLTPCLPWQYPRLSHDLRRIIIIVKLETLQTLETSTFLESNLTSIVEELRYGSRLSLFHLRVGPHPFAAHSFFNEEAWRPLMNMRVRGDVRVIIFMSRLGSMGDRENAQALECAMRA